MSDFIEINANTNDKCLVNLSKVHKIIPVIGGHGCILHFDNGKTQSASDSYLVLSAKLTKKVEENVPSAEKVVVEKKETAKTKS